MNLQENINRIKQILGLITEEKSFENKPIILVGPQGIGKSTTAKALAKRLNIPYISSDLSMINKKYVNLCKNEPGIEVKIKEHPKLGTYYDSNKEYPLCVLNKLMDEHLNNKIVFDIGGTHAYINKTLSDNVKKIFTKSPNLFVFNILDNKDNAYEILKKRRENRGDEINKDDYEKFKNEFNSLNDYYSGTQNISILDNKNKEKTTNQLVDEIINKLK